MNDVVMAALAGFTLVLFFVSAFFSSSETALMAVNRLRLRALADGGDEVARRVLALVDNTGRLLSGILLGNNFANVLLASISTVLATQFLGDMAPFYVSPILTVLLLIFAEILPKTIAAERALTVARLCSRPLAIFMALTSPLITLTTKVAEFFLRPLNRNKSGDEARSVSYEDLLMIAEVGREEGSFGKVTHHILHGVYEFAQSAVRQVLVPRHEIVSMPIAGGLTQFEEILRSTGHSRVPVWGENEEDLLGILHAKDLLLQDGRESAADNLRSIVRPPTFIPESTKLGKALEHIQDSGSEMVFVVDEYGGLEGLVTLKDILEELVGEIQDEHDKTSRRRVDIIRPGTFVADARTTLRYIRRKTGLDLAHDHDGVSTLGGLIVAEGKEDLSPGTKLEIAGNSFTVLTMNGRYLKKVRVDTST
ncbi:MAG: hemolysin family protein [Planctomycetota bacterium]